MVAVVGQVDVVGRRPLRQAGHRHHVAAHHHHEARARGEPHLADVQLVPGGAPRSVASVEKEYCVFATQTGSAAVPVRLDALQPAPRLAVPGHLAGAVQPARDRLRLLGQRQVVVVGEGELVRARAPRAARARPWRGPSAPAPPSAKCVAGKARTPVRVDQLDDPRDLRVGVGREPVDRDDARDAVDLADVVAGAGAGSPCRARRRRGPPSPGRRRRRRRGTSAPAPSRPRPRRPGRSPDLRHLMSTNFSAPRSAPKPASVTT